MLKATYIHFFVQRWCVTNQKFQSWFPKKSAKRIFWFLHGNISVHMEIYWCICIYRWICTWSNITPSNVMYNSGYTLVVHDIFGCTYLHDPHVPIVHLYIVSIKNIWCVPPSIFNTVFVIQGKNLTRYLHTGHTVLIWPLGMRCLNQCFPPK